MPPQGPVVPVIHLPAELRPLAGGLESLELPGARIRDLLAALYARYPALETPIKTGMAVAIDGTIVNQPLNEPLTEQSTIHLIPRISGG